MSYDPGFDGVVGALPLNAPQAPTAAHHLKRSHLKLTQQEMMGHDVDLTRFYASFNNGGVDLVGAMTDASVERTVEGASQLTCTITDEEKILLNSGLLHDQLTVEIDGLFWMLVKISVAGPTITLTFNEREVVIARRYNKPIKQSVKTSRARVTRAEFALRMLREIKELPPIPYVIPALKVPQPIGTKAAWLAHNQQKTHAKGLGIPKHNDLKVKSVHMTEEQRKNADQILDTGASSALPEKFLLCAIMCAIQESSIINLRADQSPGGHVGCFQQDPRYWPASRNIPKDAKAFYHKLGQVFSAHPNYSDGEAIYTVQNPGPYEGSVHKAIGLYERWLPEAVRIVADYGVVKGGQGSAADANNTYNAGQGDVVYEFYRGRPPTSSYQKKHGDAKWGKENTWDCWQRLASEVQWRCFFVSGTFYFISEDDLWKQKPIVTIDHHEEGIIEFDGNYDSQGSSSDVTITCRMGRWAAPPGSIIRIKDHGPWDGRWLVNDVSRGLFESTGTITLKKPLPALPEPGDSNVNSSGTPVSGRWARGGGKGGGGAAGDLVNPFSGGWIPNRLDMGWDGTFKGKLLAPFDGIITYSGYISGDHPWGGYIVIKAHHDVPGLPTKSLYFAEGVAGTKRVGDHVKAGDVIGTPEVSPYGNPYGTGTHGQIEWGVAQDESPGTYSKPHAQALGLGTQAAKDMVRAFVFWAHHSLGVHGAPTTTYGAGNS